MQARSFGKIAVPTPGTPVRLTTDTTLRVARLRFAAVIGETGRVFLGVAGMNKATGAGVIKEFWPTGAGGGVADQIEITAIENRHLLTPADYYVDANTATEGLIASSWSW
jgi:hypothetical protein